MTRCSLVVGVCALLGLGMPALAAADETEASSEGVKVAVLEFDALGVSEMEAKVVTERLRAELARTEGYRVMGRRMMEALLAEQGLGDAGEGGKQDLVKLGKVLGVGRLLTGSISKIGTTFSLVANLVDVQTGQTLRAVIEDHRGEIETFLSVSVGKVAARLAEHESAGYLAFVGNGKGDTLDHLVLKIDEKPLKEFSKADFVLITAIPKGIHRLNMEWIRPGIDAKRGSYTVDVHAGEVITLECNAIKFQPTLRVVEPVGRMGIRAWRDYNWREVYPTKRYAGKSLEYLSEFDLKDLWIPEH